MISFRATFALGDERWEYGYMRGNCKQKERALSAYSAPSKRRHAKRIEQSSPTGEYKETKHPIASATSRAPLLVDAGFSSLSAEAQDLQRLVRERRHRKTLDAEEAREWAADVGSLRILQHATAHGVAEIRRRPRSHGLSKHGQQPSSSPADSKVPARVDADQTSSSGPWSVISSPPTSDLCKFLRLHTSPVSSQQSVRRTPTPSPLSARRLQPWKLLKSFEQAQAAVAEPRQAASGLREEATHSHGHVADPFGSQLVEGGKEKERCLKASMGKFGNRQTESVSKLFEEVQLKDEAEASTPHKEAFDDPEADSSGSHDTLVSSKDSPVKLAPSAQTVEEILDGEQAKDDEHEQGEWDDVENEWLVTE